jgi:hypothetical protein
MRLTALDLICPRVKARRENIVRAPGIEGLARLLRFSGAGSLFSR